MPRYYFHVHDHLDLPDVDGIELADLGTARAEAVRLCGALLKEQADIFWQRDAWRMDVTDEEGTTLFSLSFVATHAPGLEQLEAA